MEIGFHQVSYWYAKGTPFETRALKEVSLQIPSGQFVALMGHTASGKTTLAQMINGLLFPHHGEVKVGTYRITGKRSDLRSLRSQIGYVFQDPEQQLVAETVFQDISFGLRSYQLSEQSIASRTREIMEVMGLPYETFKDRSPFHLSLGEMRRVALAGVLCLRPKIIILDEPTAGLDGLGRNRFLSLVKRIHQQEGITIVYITHRLEEALEFADRIVVLSQGELYADLTPAEVPKRMQDLSEAGLAPTPLLEFMNLLVKKAPGKIPNHIVKEQHLVEYLLKTIKGDR